MLGNKRFKDKPKAYKAFQNYKNGVVVVLEFEWLFFIRNTTIFKQ